MRDFWTIADEIPALPGAYVLAISLSKLVMVSICREPLSVVLSIRLSGAAAAARGADDNKVELPPGLEFLFRDGGRRRGPKDGVRAGGASGRDGLLRTAAG
jgi:hypothetical protein